MAALNKSELEEALKGLDGWSVENDQLKKAFKFNSYRDATAFLMRLAFDVEEMNHHPHIENIYNSVQFSLSTHDAGGKVTEKDIKLAECIERLIQKN